MAVPSLPDSEYARLKYDTLKFSSIIHTTSGRYPKYHNLMLDEHFSALKNGTIAEEQLARFVKPYSFFVDSSTDEISSIIKMSIKIANEKTL